MKRKEFYSILNKILDDCGRDMPEGGKRRPFLAYSWKKYYNRSNFNLADISKFKNIKNILLEKDNWSIYIGLMLHRVDNYY